MTSKKIYIVLLETSTIPAKIVKFFTRNKINHSSIALNKELNPMYSFGRKSINNFLNGGFVLEHLNKGFFEKFSDTKINVYEINVTKKQYDLLSQKLTEFTLNNALKYNFLGAILLPLNIGFAPKNYFTCSQFVCKVMTECSIFNLNKKYSLVTPKDFLMLFNNSKEIDVTLIFQGKMIDYK